VERLHFREIDSLITNGVASDGKIELLSTERT
jgi:hypothetical protein